jgi:hypothetical protein
MLDRTQDTKRIRVALWVTLAAAGQLLIGCGGGARLIVKDEMVASWIVMNNGFAYEGVTGPPHRTGILFQIGDCFDPDGEKGPKSIPDRVILSRHGTTVLELKRGDFAWIDLLAEGEGPPMEPDQAKCLFPATVKPAGLSCTEDLYDSCLRNRKIHAHQQVQSIITYWQGEKGFRLEAKQLPGADPRNNQQSFWLKDPVAVTVYDQVQDESTGDWAMVPRHKFDTGDIDLIELTFASGPPSHGARHDPAWPTEGP